MKIRKVGTETCKGDSVTTIGDEPHHQFKFELSLRDETSEWLYSKSHFDYLNVKAFCLLAESQQLSTFCAQNVFTTENLNVPLERWVVLTNEHDKYAAIYLTRLSGEDKDRQVHFVYVILDSFS